MPPRQQQGQPQYLDENHQRISEFAAWMWDGDEDEDARDSFVTDAMSHKGYTPRTRTDWEPPAEQTGGSNGSQGAGGQRQKPPGYFKR